MAIIETKADELMRLIHRHKSITIKEACTEMNVNEDYVRRLAKVFEKNKLINLKATAFSLTMLARRL